MVGIRKVKIKRKVYKFDVRKRYYSEHHYKVKKKEPIEVIRERFKKMLAPKKEEKKKPRRIVPEKEKKAPGFNFALAGLAIFIALVVLLGGFLFLSLGVTPPPSVFKPPTDKPMISNSVLDSTVLTAGDVGTDDYVASVLIDYETENIGNYTIRLETYEKRLPSEVFVLQSARYQAASYSSFMFYLRNNLSKTNILVNEITVGELETLPQGAVVIIPSGAVPQEILGVESTLTPQNLVDRGMVVIYIGGTFDEMHDGTQPVPTPSEVAQYLPFDFDEGAGLVSSEGFTLFQPLYRVTSRVGWTSDLAYGSVSILTKGDGAFVFLPQTLDGGWRQDPLIPGKEAAQFAAEDVARIILENPWADPDGAARTYEFSVEEENAGTKYFYTEPFQGEERSVKIYFTGESSADPDLFVEELQITRAEKEPLGDLYVYGGVVVVSTNITSEAVRMLADLNEPAAAQPDMYLVISDTEGAEAMRQSEGRVSVQISHPIDVQLNLKKGEYTTAFVDDESKVYAQSYLRIVTVDITARGTYERRSNYRFELRREGVPIELSSVSVEVDGGEYGTYDFTNVRGVVFVDIGSYTGGDGLPPGDHTFTFIIGGLREDVGVRIAPPSAPPLFTNPLFLGTIILSIGIVGMGIMFARKEEVFYAVDVPDFPPIARTKIPLASDTVLSIFERVNEGYHWKHTPLTLGEIKNGFRDIFYKGKPIYITDYNAEYLLDTLIGKGRVIKALNYYGPASWEKKSKKSMTYLAMMRKLRDICVNNAIPFTQMGESKNADSEITAVGQQMFLHFYERSAEVDEKILSDLIRRALTTIDMGITIMLFKNDIKKRIFATLLDSPSSAQLLMKLEVENRSVLLLTMSEFEKMIKELKSV